MEQVSLGHPASAALARQHELRGELAEASALWQACLRVFPDDYNARLGHGRVLFLSEQFKAATNALRGALDVDPRGAEALFFLSRAVFEEGDLPAAQDFFRQAVSLDPLLDHPLYRDRLFGTPLPPAVPLHLAPLGELDPAPVVASQHTAVVTLKHFWGADDLLTRLRSDVIDKAADQVKHCLLFGPQDCGKRFLASCLAGEMGARTLELDGDALEHAAARDKARQEIGAFLARDMASPHMIIVRRVESLAAEAARVRGGLQAVLRFLAPTLNAGPVTVCFLADVPWLIPARFRQSPWFLPALFVPPPDVAARARLLDGAFGESMPWDTLQFLIERTEGFTAADLSALTMLMEQHQAGLRGRDEARVERYLEEDRAAIGPIDWRVVPQMVALVTPTAAEWFKEAHRVRFDQRHAELQRYCDRLLLKSR